MLRSQNLSKDTGTNSFASNFEIKHPSVWDQAHNSAKKAQFSSCTPNPVKGRKFKVYGDEIFDIKRQNFDAILSNENIVFGKTQSKDGLPKNNSRRELSET